MVAAVVADFRSAPITEPEKQLLAYVEKLTFAPSTIAALGRAGWSDEAVYDAITVCALFNFYNRWVDGSGVEDMTPEGYIRSGERLATNGYAENVAGAANTETLQTVASAR